MEQTHRENAPTVETLTVEQAAKILQVTPETIRRWLRTGKLTGADTPAGWRMTPDDLQSWMARHRGKTQEAMQP